MMHSRHWALGAKLALVAVPFLLLALISVALAMWISWQIESGGAAVREAGRMRAQVAQMALTAAHGADEALPAQADAFAASLRRLRDGDPDRTPAVAWDDAVQARFAVVERDWQHFREHLGTAAAAPPPCTPRPRF